jgi:hypothetical protein
MPASDFHEFMAYESLEPFGECGDYFRAGIIASTNANIHRGKDQSPYSPSDFIPSLDNDEKESELTDEELHAKFAALVVKKKTPLPCLRSSEISTR